MQRPLGKSVPILALLLAVPVLGLAWTVRVGPVSQEFDKRPQLNNVIGDRGGKPLQKGPVTAINLPTASQKHPAMSGPPDSSNEISDRRDSQPGEKNLASIFSFLLPAKEDLEKIFKAEDDNFFDRGRANSDPFSKKIWK
jgi:hypothetical protein